MFSGAVLVGGVTSVSLFSQRDDGVIDQRKLLVFPDRNPIEKSAVITEVLHEDLRALLTHTGGEGDVKAL